MLDFCGLFTLHNDRITTTVLNMKKREFEKVRSDGCQGNNYVLCNISISQDHTKLDWSIDLLINNEK